MLRSGPLCALILAALVGCADLTNVSPPPVPLSAIDRASPAVGGGGTLPVTTAATRLVHAVPSRALLTIHLPDIGGTLRRFKKTSLHTLLTSPEMAAVLGPVKASFTGLPFGAPGGKGMVDPDKILKSLKGELIVSLEDISFDATGKPKTLRLVAGVTVRGAEREAEQVVELVTMLAASNDAMRVEKGSQSGAAFTRLVGKEPSPYVLEMAVHRDAFLFGVGRESVTTAITRLEGNGEGSLAKDPDFRRATQRCAHPHDALRIHVDVAEAMDRFGKHIPTDAAHILEALGVDKYKSLVSAVRLEGADITVSTLLDSPGGEDFLTSLLSAHPVDRHFLSRIPGDAAAFSLFALDGKRALNHLRETLRPDMLADVEESLSRARSAGVDIEREVLDVFGPRCAVISLPREGIASTGLDAIWDHLLGTGFLVEVTDAEAADKVLAKLAKTAATVNRREYDVDGTKAVTFGFEKGQVPTGLTISYAHVDDYLVVALSEEALRRMLAKRTPETLERYRELLREVPETATMLSYDNMQQGFGLLMSAFFGGLNASMRGTSTGIDMRPPSFDGIMRNFNPAISYTVADKRGIFSKTRSPTGGLGGVGGLSGLMVLASVAIPDFAIARARANETSALATLRAVHNAEQTYRQSRIRDSDRDQEGEFGFLMDLVGEPRPGDQATAAGASLLTDMERGEQGHFESKGYYFRVYLPAEDGSPVGGHEGAERLGEVDGDLAETVVVVVAWPKSKTTTGHRSFVMDSAGTIYACGEGPYEAENAPPPDVCTTQKGNLASESRPATGPAWDGCIWTRVR